tara:strand:- start:404 stop:724 length:321 start_codon:yes stop_codon:yes gene_type:complete
MSRIKQQRLMQLPAVCEYMGIKKKFFDTKIRSLLTEVKLGYKTIAFEKDEVDKLIDSIKKGESLCKQNYRQESKSTANNTTLTKGIAQARDTSQSAYARLLSPQQK